MIVNLRFIILSLPPTLSHEILIGDSFLGSDYFYK